jgi:UDP-3-O-[3-hydroxymyristoyl] glucosamine N-acyltransferase
MIGGQVGLAGHLQVANRTIITAQSGISKNIKKEGTVLSGSPAVENAENLDLMFCIVSCQLSNNVLEKLKTN